MMEGFSTKQKGDVAEYRVISELLHRGVPVLKPLGDRMPYDLAVDHGGKILRIQVKLAWYDARVDAHFISVKRSQTNRKVYKFSRYTTDDFDFLIAWIAELDVFYIFPAEFACKFAGMISLVEGMKRQRAPRSAWFRNRWDLLITEEVKSQQAVAASPPAPQETEGEFSLEELMSAMEETSSDPDGSQ